MEPQLFSRGNMEGAAVATPSKTCFNGAAAFQPRKFGRYRPLSPGSGRFNGAAAFQPRKCDNNHARLPNKRALQWSRSFSAAEIILHKYLAMANKLLQWSRSFSAAEIRIKPAEVRKPKRASMEPQLFSRGNNLFDLLLHLRKY